MVRQKKVKINGEPPQMTVRTGHNTYKDILDQGTCKILGGNTTGRSDMEPHTWRKAKLALFPLTQKTDGGLKTSGGKVPQSCRKNISSRLHSEQTKLPHSTVEWNTGQHDEKSPGDLET